MDDIHALHDFAENGVAAIQPRRRRQGDENWLPPVSGPALAIDRIPSLSWARPSPNSSGMQYPGPPMPVPVGSPP